MGSGWFETWLLNAPLLTVGGALLLAMFLAALIGAGIQEYRDHRNRKRGVKEVESQEAYIVSAVLGLMALLLGFTFSLAVDRYDGRRAMVLESANAVGTAYLRAQLLEEPHRSRMSGILLSYTENVVRLGGTKPGEVGAQAMLDRDDQLLTELWAATAAAFDSVRDIDFSSALVESVNALIDDDAARRALRQAHVPPAVFVVLFIYLVVAAGVLGHVLRGTGGRIAAAFLMGLMTLSLMLIVDIDRPTLGRVNESQAPMIAALKSMKSQPPEVFDRWRGPASAAAPAPAR